MAQAVFGRPPPALRGSVVRNGYGSRGGGSGRSGGGTVAAAEHLASAISALDGDVKAAAVLAEHGESFRYRLSVGKRQHKKNIACRQIRLQHGSRPTPTMVTPTSSGKNAIIVGVIRTAPLGSFFAGWRQLFEPPPPPPPSVVFRREIARWAARQSTTTKATAQPPPASALALSRPMSTGDSHGGRGDGSPARTSEEVAERYDPSERWILKVFRRHTTGVVDRNSNSGNGSNVGDGSFSMSAGERSRLVPLVVVNALRVPLAPVTAVKSSVPPATSTTSVRLPERESGAGSGSDFGGRGGGGSAWRNPLSWLTGNLRPMPPAAGSHALPRPPPRPRIAPPPRVIVRVVYAADASDMLERLVMSAERRDGELVRRRTATSDDTDASGSRGGRGEDEARR